MMFPTNDRPVDDTAFANAPAIDQFGLMGPDVDRFAKDLTNQLDKQCANLAEIEREIVRLQGEAEKSRRLIDGLSAMIDKMRPPSFQPKISVTLADQPAPLPIVPPFKVGDMARVKGKPDIMFEVHRVELKADDWKIYSGQNEPAWSARLLESAD